jgi:hypothetical protein
MYRTHLSSTDDLSVELGRLVISCSSGKQLASLYAGDKTGDTLFEYLPDAALENVSNLQDFARVLVVDKVDLQQRRSSSPFSSDEERKTKDTRPRLSTRDFASTPANGLFRIHQCVESMPGLAYIRA